MAYKSVSLPVEVNGVEDLLSNDFALVDSFVAENSLWMSGDGALGKLGTNSTTSYSSPVQTIFPNNDWVQVSCGLNMTAAIKANGSLWMWGSDFYSNLGDSYPGGSTAFDRSSPIQVSVADQSLFGWKQVSCSRDSTLAIDGDGALYSWGRGAYYTLGYGSLNNRTVPELVATKYTNTNWKQVSHGDYAAAAIKIDGSLWTWGRNDNANTTSPGMLGRTTIVTELLPGQTIAGGNTWLQVSCGAQIFAAVKIDGTLWTWGTNNFGQLGDNSTTNRYSPVQTAIGGTDWKQVGCGSNEMAAIKNSGTLWTWGYNGQGQLGQGDTTNRSTPVQVSPNTTWKIVKGRNGGFSAIKTDNTLWGWGTNSSGALGVGDTTPRSIPVQIGYNYYRDIAEGPSTYFTSAAIRFNGSFEELLT